MAEGARLEIEYGAKSSIEGSNPSLSAIIELLRGFQIDLKPPFKVDQGKNSISISYSTVIL